MLDTGNLDLSYVCPAKLLTFDLTTDRLINKRWIPDLVALNKSGNGLLISPTIYYEDSDSHCQRPTVFKKITFELLIMTYIVFL